MKCTLCGYEFDQTNAVCHGRCPLADGCAIICCPNCGYQAVDESKSRATSLIRKLQELLSEKPHSTASVAPSKERK